MLGFHFPHHFSFFLVEVRANIADRAPSSKAPNKNIYALRTVFEVPSQPPPLPAVSDGRAYACRSLSCVAVLQPW